MTPQEWANKMDERLRSWEQDKIYISAIQGTIAQMVGRVFNRGLNSQGRRIGSYSTKTMLATRSQFAQRNAFKQSIAASGITMFSNIKTRKVSVKRLKLADKKLWIRFKGANKAVPVMILEGGYKQFRAIQGRESSFVNLKFRSELFNDLASAKLVKVEGGYDYMVKRNINVLKISGLTKRFGGNPIFDLTKNERLRFKDNLRSEFLKRMSA